MDKPSHPLQTTWAEQTLRGEKALRILHLEDSELDHELTVAHLQEHLPWQLETRCVDSEAGFLRGLEELRPHLVISDYQMPNFNGMRAYTLLREREAHLPFVMLTGAMGEETAVETLRSGVSDYVLKQSLDRLAPAVLRALQAEAERQRRELAEAEIRALNVSLRLRVQQVEELNKTAEAQRQQLETNARKLEEALTMQKTFLAETSHELRTPLTALLGYLRRASREHASSEHSAGVSQNLAQTLSDATRVAENMTRLVGDLLELSRGELVQSIECHFLDLSQLLREVGRDHGVGVSAPAEIEAVGDPGRLVQVFQNLLSNSIRVSGGPAKVSIEACVQGQQAEVRVIDHGPGVPDDVKSKIFDKFYRGKEAGSAGLGLTIAHQVVQAHSGSIAVEDTPGGGATFVVKLPLYSEDEDFEGVLGEQ